MKKLIVAGCCAALMGVSIGAASGQSGMGNSTGTGAVQPPSSSATTGHATSGATVTPSGMNAKGMVKKPTHKMKKSTVKKSDTDSMSK